jgi:hypothetical protein
VYDTKSGDLNDLEPAIRQNLDKYLAFVDVGDAFQKLQVAATNNVNWNETIGDLKLNDPIQSLLIEVGYPNFSNPWVPITSPIRSSAHREFIMSPATRIRTGRASSHAGTRPMGRKSSMSHF